MRLATAIRMARQGVRVIESLQSSVTYTGASGTQIVFTFDQPYYCGQYVNGDWYVRPASPGGTVTISSISPKYTYATAAPGTNNSSDTTARNGYEINPRGSSGQGFDYRTTGGGPAFNSSYIPPLPITLTPSRVDYSNSTISVVKAYSITGTPGDITPLQFVAVLTVVDSAPIYNWVMFRPSYRGNWGKNTLSTSQIVLGNLPSYSSAGLTALLPATGAMCSFATNVMTCNTAPSPGAFAVGQLITAAGVALGTVISSLGSGSGGLGTYNLSTTPGTIANEATTGGYTFSNITTQLQGVKLDHCGSGGSRYLHALDNFAPVGGMGGASYQATITNLNAAALIRFMMSDFSYSGAAKTALNNYLQAAIDTAATCYALPNYPNTTAAVVPISTTTLQWSSTAINFDESFQISFPSSTIPGITASVAGTSCQLYYVVNPTSTTFQISATKYGSPITFTNSGSATASISWVGHCTGASATYNPGDIVASAGGNGTWICRQTAANRFSAPSADLSYWEYQCQWIASGGHGAGRKPLLLAAQTIMNDPSSYFSNAIAAQQANVLFGDDGHVYQSTNRSDVLWGVGWSANGSTAVNGATEALYWQSVISDSGGKDAADWYQWIDGGGAIYINQSLSMLCTQGTNSITIAQTALQYAATPINVGAKIYTGASNVWGTGILAYVGAISNNGTTTTVTTTYSDLVTAFNVVAATNTYTCDFYSSKTKDSSNVGYVGNNTSYQTIVSANYKYNAISMRMLFGTSQGSAPSAQWGSALPFTYANRYQSSGVIANNDPKPPYTNEVLAPYGNYSATAVASASQNTSTGLFATGTQAYISGVCVQITGTPPTGFSNGTNYYVLQNGLTTTACFLAATPGGTAIIPSVSSSCNLVGQNFLPNSNTGGSGRIPAMHGTQVAQYFGYNNRFNDAAWTDWAANHL